MVGKQTCKIALALAVVAVACQAADMEYSRERYNVIIERSPFGDDSGLAAETAAQSAKDAATAAAASKAAEKELRLCFLMEAENGQIRAGFENKTARPGDPRSVMLMVGESFRGMKLLDIDLENSSATLDRSGTRVTFELSKAATAAPAAPAPVAPPRRFGGGFRSQPPERPEAPPEPQLSPEEQAQKLEETRENLRQYQMEVIRSGMPPLPIPLTKEMDDQLVAEGILPPAE